MLTPGQRVGRYEVLEAVGAGGMATVYRVRHLELGSVHALKLLGVHREVVAARLLQEGRSQARLQHPNVVRVHDVLTHEGAPVLVMEYVDGGTLLTRVERGRLPLGLLLDLAVGIAQGLGAAHEIGLVHRDLKLGNVLLAKGIGGALVPRIADFGLVKVMAESGERHTRVGTAMGTPEYMPPEQMRDASRVDPRADLYALGCVLYAMATGRLPYTAPDLAALHRKVISRDRPPLEDRVPGLPTALLQLIDDLLEPHPDDRPPSAAAVLERLRAPPMRHPTGPTTAPPEEVAAVAAAAGPEWAATYGADPRAREVFSAAPPRSALFGLMLPALAAALALAVPSPPPEPVAAPAPTEAVRAVEDVPAPRAPDPEPVAPVEVAQPPPVEPVAPPPPTRPEAPAPPPPSRQRTAVAIEGDATRVWLVRGGRRVDVPGPVAPASYEILAVFPGTEPVPSGTVTVGAEPVALSCSSFARRCRPVARGPK